MEQFNKFVERAVEGRIKNGTFAKKLEPSACPRCFVNLQPFPAKCWGKPVAGYVMDGMYAHDCEKPPEPVTTVSTEVKQVAEFVILVQGHPCFVTTSEKEFYLEGLATGNKIIEIRNYVFDRPYPILPYNEWCDQEQKRNRRTEAYMAIGD